MQYATVGGTGNQALRGALAQAKKEGLDAVDLLPPVGYHGHARRAADRHDRLSGGRAGARRLRVPSRHLALDRAERSPARCPSGATRVREFALEEDAALTAKLGLDRRPADEVLSDQVSDIMARGWESKSVESQQEEASRDA